MASEICLTTSRNIPPTRYLVFVVTPLCTAVVPDWPWSFESAFDFVLALLEVTGATSRTKSLHSWLRTARPFNRKALRSRSTGVSGCSMMRKRVAGSEMARAQPLALPPRSLNRSLICCASSSAVAICPGTSLEAKLVSTRRESLFRLSVTPLNTRLPKSIPTTESPRLAMMLGSL